jgi:tRNA-dihydrouridine synthase
MIYGDQAAICAPDVPSRTDLCDLVSGHFEDILAFYGISLGGRVARKHLGWYMDHAQTPAALRREVLTADPSVVVSLLPLALQQHQEVA